MGDSWGSRFPDSGGTPIRRATLRRFRAAPIFSARLRSWTHGQMTSSPDSTHGPADGAETSLAKKAKRGFVWNQAEGILDYGLFLFFSVVTGRAI
ncbi:MAG TPA: hypothetical protein DDZ83_15445 [Nitrospinae bacterium]|nr:hypothetical protein [Nitrospinota bacterium]